MYRTRWLMLTVGLLLSSIAQGWGQDPRITAASAALSSGAPWRASRLLAPVLADQTRVVSDQTKLLAARAASAWGGWSQAERLLVGTELSGNAAGAAAEISGRAALAGGNPNLAIDYLRRSLITAEPHDRGIRSAWLGRAFEQLHQDDSAAGYYRQAAALLPEVADWLRLSEAGVTSSSSDRTRLYQMTTLPPAISRIAWTEALALERSGDLTAAAAAYRSLGAGVRAARTLSGTGASTD